MKDIKWLHLSDLHMNCTGLETKRLRDRLLELLKTEGEFQYLFISGDLRHARLEATPSEVIEFIGRIISTIHVPLSNVFIVPGNHDVARNNERRAAAEKKVFGEKVNGKGYYSPKEGIIKPEDLIPIFEAKSEFTSLMQAIFKDDSQRISMYTDASQPHFVVETEHFNVILLDSTLSYTADRQRDLYIGGSLLYDILKGINKDKPGIILTHYSFDFLERNEQKELAAVIRDFNIKLWFSGHEHDSLIRKQMDFFYEMQAGNLMYENEAKSCIIIGEYDCETCDGNVRAYYWEPAGDWFPHQNINPSGKGKSIYPIHLKSITLIASEGINSNNSIPIRKISNSILSVNLYSLNEQNFSDVTEEELQEIKFQMGTRLKGNESKEKIISMFLTEINMTLNSEKHFDCMPLFQNVIRDVFEGYIYADNSIIPIDKVKIYYNYYDNTDTYMIEGNRYRLEIFTVDKKSVGISLGYYLSDLKDVDDRIFCFKPIGQIINASHLTIRFRNSSMRCLCFSTPLNNPQNNSYVYWDTKRKRVMRWIEEMHKLAEIEKWFNIKFSIPINTNADDFFAINVIFSSISKQRCCTHPGIPFSDLPSIKKELDIPEREISANPNLPSLRLFGFVFHPCKEYVLGCKIRKNRAKKVWETKAGGIPLGVDFSVRPETSIANLP